MARRCDATGRPRVARRCCPARLAVAANEQIARSCADGEGWPAVWHLQLDQEPTAVPTQVLDRHRHPVTTGCPVVEYGDGLATLVGPRGCEPVPDRRGARDLPTVAEVAQGTPPSHSRSAATASTIFVGGAISWTSAGRWPQRPCAGRRPWASTGPGRLPRRPWKPWCQSRCRTRSAAGSRRKGRRP